MADEALLKTKSTLDNRDFNKGVQQMKQQMRDLDKVSSDAFAAIGNALGVDVGKIKQFSSALSALDSKLNQTGQAGTSAFGSIAKSITPVAAGIAGLGLAAAIAAFKQLNAEADAFEATIQGGAIAAQSNAYVSVFRQALRDQSGTGEGVANFRATLKEAGATLAGFFQSGFNFNRMREANTLGERAKEIAGELYNIELKQKENSVTIARLDAEIAQKREIISDTTKAAEERAAALADAQELIKQKLNLQLPLEQKKAELLEEYNGLSSTTIKEYDAEIAAKISVNNLIQQEAAEQRQLLRQQSAITAATQKEAEARERIAASRASLKEWGAMASSVPEITSGAVVQIPAKIQINREQVKTDLVDISKEIESVMTSAFNSIGESLGQLIGDLATGEDAWSNFANTALSAFGDLAISVGKIAIQTGVATLGIEAALKSLNGYVAIAAGVALVALGTAIKAGLSNIANGNYSASASTATSTTTSSSKGYDYYSRQSDVHVTGTLRVSGSDLVAAITNENNRTSHTT